MKGLNKIAKKTKSKYIAAESENEYLKEKIEKLQLELENRKNEEQEDNKNRKLLNELYEKDIINESGNIIK